jgi:acyl-CoA oxidase
MADFTDKLQPADPQAPSILARERASSCIDVDQLAKHLLWRNDFLGRQKEILPILERVPIFSKKNQLNIARQDRAQLALARAKTLRRLSLKHGWDREDYLVADYLMDEAHPYVLTWGMFATSLREQCNDNQKAHWLPKVDNWEIIGCYAQTELGHGSNVRGIECQAKWDPQTQEFIIHSPTITASKWWNGALGRTANHAIVVAQLILPDSDPKAGGDEYRSYGPHQFIVQIRDMKTHKPLDGIVIGDIGPKYGYNGMDNGYMLFSNFRVPHSALLSKHSGVDPQHGTYIKPENSALIYGSMTFIRAQIIMQARLAMARAVTIAVRYLSIRHQFPDRDSLAGTSEEAVLNYPTVQIRILPLLATTFALHYTSEAMFKLYWGTRQQIDIGDTSRLAEMHAASSGLKSLCTTLAADGIETCRRAMGGHGFGGGSGLIHLNNEYLSRPTVEGDNWMITQQTASYLIKRMRRAVEKPNLKPTDSVDVQFQEYMSSIESSMKNSTISDAIRDPFALVGAFRQRVSFLAYQAYQARVVEKKPWTGLMIQLHRLSRAHSESLLVSTFYEAVFISTPDPPLEKATIDALQTLFRLFSLFTLELSASDFLVSGALTVEMIRSVTPAIQQLMAQVRPDAVRLVDAWSIPDFVLDSALGSYDGDVYNRLFQKAHKENPLNLLTFNPDWKTEEIVMGEGEENARKRLEALALGLAGYEHSMKPKL